MYWSILAVDFEEGKTACGPGSIPGSCICVDNQEPTLYRAGGIRVGASRSVV